GGAAAALSPTGRPPPSIPVAQRLHLLRNRQPPRRGRAPGRKFPNLLARSDSWPAPEPRAPSTASVVPGRHPGNGRRTSSSLAAPSIQGTDRLRRLGARGAGRPAVAGRLPAPRP